MSKLSLLAAHELTTEALESVSGGCGRGGNGSGPRTPGWRHQRQVVGIAQANTVTIQGDFINNGDGNTFIIASNVVAA